MTRKEEIQARIVAIQAEYSELSAEIKQIQADEKLARDMERFKDYKLKVVLTADGLGTELEALEERDHSNCFFDQDSLAYMKYPTSKTKDYLLLKSEEDFPRMKRLFEIRWATHRLHEGIKAEDQIAILLGENNGN